jgi:hypothetical protein
MQNPFSTGQASAVTNENRWSKLSVETGYETWMRKLG